MEKKKLRYVLVGTGQRSWMYINALIKEHSADGELCALCDTNTIRMNFWNEYITEKSDFPKVPVYKAEDFDKMIADV